jgi:hypothetical protein
MPPRTPLELAWDRLLEADHLHRYWAEMSTRTARAERLVAVATIVLGSATALTTFSDLFGPWATRASALATAIFSSISLAQRFSRSTHVSARAFEFWTRERTRLERLWTVAAQLQDDELTAELDKTSDQAAEIDRETAAAMTTRKRLNQRTWSETVASYSHVAA